MIQLDPLKQYDYVVGFLQKKTKIDGFKQTDIAAFIGKSPTYINKLVGEKKRKRILETAVIEKISDFFNLDTKQLFEEGKAYLEIQGVGIDPSGDQNNNIDRRSRDPEKLVQRCTEIIQGIHDLETKAEKKEDQHKQEIVKKEQEIDLFKIIFSKLKEGITFFDKNRKFIYSSNRWGFLDGIDLQDSPTLDSIMMHTAGLIDNFTEVQTAILAVHQRKKEDKIVIRLKNSQKFLFTVVPIFNEKTYIGLLIINEPAPE